MHTTFTLLDGAMGTMLQNAGLPVGALPEVWNITNPEAVTHIGRQYAAAGSQVIYANTFGANRHKLSGCGYTVSEVISAGIRNAKEAATPFGARVALDVGPIGTLLESLGSLSFEEAYDIFREIVVAGEAAGADLIVFETMSDLLEAKAAVLAAKENTSLPVWVTMTYEKTGRTFLGVTVPAMALTLTGLGVDALGFNCSLGPGELIPLVEELSRWTHLPMILKPNAGLPHPETGEYAMEPGEFAEAMSRAAELGVSILGGCCGTTPEFIGALKAALREIVPGLRPKKTKHGVCSGTMAADLRNVTVTVIGERINPTGKKRFQQALREKDFGYLQEQAVAQQDAGAQILDVNVGLPDIDEKETMVSAIRAIQAVVDLPLQIDSSNPEVLEGALRVYNGKPIINSVNGDRETLDKILPLCKKYGAAVVGLCMDHTGIPKTAEERIAIAEKILAAAEGYGIPREDVYMDCLALTVSAQQEQAAETLKAIRYVREKLGLHTVLGVSNISFGLPARENITVGFLTGALWAGLDLPILNPNQKPVMDAIASFRALSGEDTNCEGYIARFSQELAPKTEKASEMTLETAVVKGLKEEASALTRKALETMEPLGVVDGLLIPALDRVGMLYEKNKIFLPQLMSAANAACEGFEVIRQAMAGKGTSVSKGKIILATVKGDIHDIGKNIVKVVLENYGFTVLDLGRDVAPERVVETAIRENVSLVGLSALMTTTVKSMEETIAALRQSGHRCAVMVGGAVLTPEYAKKIGADFYAKDAKEAADVAKAYFMGSPEK